MQNRTRQDILHYQEPHRWNFATRTHNPCRRAQMWDAICT